MGQERLYGAAAPTGVEWQIGKTAASIQFVRKAEEVMRVLSTGPVRLEILKLTVEAVKAGKIIVTDDKLNPQDFTYF